MSNSFKYHSEKFLTSKQNSILSAASVITVMIILSQIFGLVRQWIILRFLGKEMFSLFMAAFRLPDLVFEVFAFGAFSSAFIPVFSKYLKKDESEAWDIAARVINIAIVIFLIISLIFSLFSKQFYSVVAMGFSDDQIDLVSKVARFIFLAQGFFVISYVITGVLESSRRFLVPALAPVFYNIGIIAGTMFFSQSMGIYAPALGVVIGALMHLLIQLPVAYKLGFRFLPEIRPTEGVVEVGKLAAPRFIDLAFLQIQKSGELFFSSLMSTASYAFLNLGLSLQAIPIMLFGVSLGKATLVSLSHEEDVERFKNIFLTTLNQMMFIVLPISFFMAVLRVPIVRLTYGTSSSLDWDATLQIGLVLTYFAFGIPFQAALALINRAFFAKHDTKTPVVFAVIDVVITIMFEYLFVIILKLPVWSIALANSLAVCLQASILYSILIKRLGGGSMTGLYSTFKSLFFAVISSSIMFFTLKFFDRSVWIKNLSFIGSVADKNLPFEKFVLDTRYTFNLVILAVIVGLLGTFVYLLLSFISKSEELATFTRIIFRKNKNLDEIKKESITVMEPEG
jgi:putative peptidoglycan lipid II flippase